MFDSILDAITSATGMSATIAIVLEFVLRLVKSDKPLSILYVISNVIKKLSEILTKVSDLLDKVIPQRLK